MTSRGVAGPLKSARKSMFFVETEILRLLTTVDDPAQVQALHLQITERWALHQTGNHLAVQLLSQPRQVRRFLPVKRKGIVLRLLKRRP